jgi:hypothetical protein
VSGIPPLRSFNPLYMSAECMPDPLNELADYASKNGYIVPLELEARAEPEHAAEAIVEARIGLSLVEAAG